MPVRASRDHRLFDSYPALIAVFHALQSLLTPRHPPYALSNLTTKIKRSGKSAFPPRPYGRGRQLQCERLLAAPDSPVLTGDFRAALPKNIAAPRVADTPGGHVTISPSPAPFAFSCESARRASNAKCLGELSTTPAFRPRLSCPLATDTLLNSRNQTICRQRRVTRTSRRRRIVQFKMPITTTKLSKNKLELALPA
jgi:hypothetical protein